MRHLIILSVVEPVLNSLNRLVSGTELVPFASRVRILEDLLSFPLFFVRLRTHLFGLGL